MQFQIKASPLLVSHFFHQLRWCYLLQIIMRTLPLIRLAWTMFNYFLLKVESFPRRHTHAHTLKQSSLSQLNCVHHNSDSSYPRLCRTVPGHYSSPAPPPPHPPHLQPPQQHATLLLHGTSVSGAHFNVVFDRQQRDLSNCPEKVADTAATVWEDVTYLGQKMTSGWKKEIIMTNGEMAQTRGAVKEW